MIFAFIAGHCWDLPVVACCPGDEGERLWVLRMAAPPVQSCASNQSVRDERATFGSQVGSHSRWPPADRRVRGHPRTRLGHLRIRRLGVRVAPGALSEAPA
jgi:hypothetical protein